MSILLGHQHWLVPKSRDCPYIELLFVPVGINYIPLQIRSASQGCPLGGARG